ncbi:hypothetical protein CPB84DRAFT_1838237 [Gymnopilus junonius]|uniref:Senescence domain-containing protein n=1 Tax=Gymnopilus junonius TaxID=109634 RepID=A0A9P5NCG2_GYMJU|nr:hypothetical protein CPB84DRAFT_1838237 [Gymnopilus junonius]
MLDIPEAYLLISLPNATLTPSGSNTEMGDLKLECVSVPTPDSKESQDRNVYLILRVNATEMPVDPTTVVRRSENTGFRTYSFTGTQVHPIDLIVKVEAPNSNNEVLDKLEAFENILAQYVAEYHDLSCQAAHHGGCCAGDRDLRGRLVMINDDTGEVVGEVEDRFRIKEDPVMHEMGHENDPVIIEVPEESTRQADANALEAFARIVPPEQRNWITSSASVVSHAISMTTNLLLTTITSASSFYISHSTPSPHHSNAPSASTTPSAKKTRKGFATVHAMSGEAVKISTKTIGLIDKMIRRAMGVPASGPASSLAPNGPTPPPLPPRTPSPSRSSIAPPPYTPGDEKLSYLGDQKSSLSPRQLASPAPTTGAAPPLPPRSGTANKSYPVPTSASGPPSLPPRLKTRDHLLISADLILSTVDDSLRKVLDVSSEQVGRVVQHKYGSEAAQTSMLMTGTARNVGLVYIDMRGIGRRALLRRAGKEFVKARFTNKAPEPQAQGQQ